jgi:outer membrane protein OmpA-like peptidoglycan-associated protein
MISRKVSCFMLPLLPAAAALLLPVIATADPALRMAQDVGQPALESDLEKAIEARKKRKPNPPGLAQEQPPPQPEAQPKTAAPLEAPVEPPPQNPANVEPQVQPRPVHPKTAAPSEPQLQQPPAEPAEAKTAAPEAPQAPPPPQPPAQAKTAEPLDLEPQEQPPPAKPSVTVINPAKAVAPIEPVEKVVVPAKPVTPPQAVAPAPVTPAASPATVAPAPNPAGPFNVKPAAPRRNPFEGTITVKPTAPNIAPPAASPTPPPAAAPAVIPAASPPPNKLEDVKNARVRSVEAGGKRVVIREADKRVIVKENNKVIIQSDENERLKRVAPTANFQQLNGGGTKAVIERPGNTRIISETDQNGQIMRRYRQDGSGRETNIIDNRQRKKDRFGRNLAIGIGVGVGVVAGAAILNSIVNVPKPRVTIPREKYVVRYQGASEDDVYEALNAPPVDRGSGRSYTLDQVRATPRLRERMRRVDLDDINFEFGSWEVEPAEYRKLERVARAMMRVIRRNPNEVFLIEGYTDAVGSEVDNLALSDRRAEAVAQVLTEQFQVPFENLTTQGYGENYLKIQTLAPERANRRSAVRRITPLLARGGDIDQPPPPPPPRRDDDERRRYDNRQYDDRQYDNDERRYDDRDRNDRNRDYDQRN